MSRFKDHSCLKRGISQGALALLLVFNALGWDEASAQEENVEAAAAPAAEAPSAPAEPTPAPSTDPAPVTSSPTEATSAPPPAKPSAKKRRVRRKRPTANPEPAVQVQPVDSKPRPTPHGIFLGVQAFSWQDTTEMTLTSTQTKVPLRASVVGASLAFRYDYRRRWLPVHVDITMGIGQAHVHDVAQTLRFNQSHRTMLETSMTATWLFVKRKTIWLGLGPYGQYRIIDLSLPTSDSAYDRGLFLYGGALSLSWRWADSLYFNQSLSLASANAEPTWRAGLLWMVQ